MNQGIGAIAIGTLAGYTNQGSGAIAIGYNAGTTNQAANSIVINASTGFTTVTAAGFYAAPIRNITQTSVLGYDTTAKEITYWTKTFVIDHPIDKNKYLVHGCLEGPEAGVYYRGKEEITNNESVTILLPDYVKNLVREFTVQLTPIFNKQSQNGRNINQLYTSEVENNSFTVYGENCKFFWLVQGKRADIEVEPLKNSVDVKGTGPYKWI